MALLVDSIGSLKRLKFAKIKNSRILEIKLTATVQLTVYVDMLFVTRGFFKAIYLMDGIPTMSK